MVAQKRPNKRPDKAPESPFRLRARRVCQLLDISLTKLRELVLDQTFTLTPGPGGRGRGKPAFYQMDEIKIFAETNDPEKVREYRRKLGRLKEDTKEKKRGRSK